MCTSDINVYSCIVTFLLYTTGVVQPVKRFCFIKITTGYNKFQFTNSALLLYGHLVEQRFSVQV